MTGILMILFIKKVITSRKCNLKLSQIVGDARKNLQKCKCAQLPVVRNFAWLYLCKKFNKQKFTTMIEIPTNKRFASDYEAVVTDVLKQLTAGEDMYGEGEVGSAYIDWGVNGSPYKNCPSKSVADQVAQAFKEKDYYVYVQRMGYGSRRIPEGTPMCYRIFTTRQNTSMDEM